ncbi:MAG TPA: ATP-binding cassette domain-containing protein [Flavisolibacter sp.]|jgi:ABC-2 type transport system ATP-binding protein|nr:ATP-binding cassette domain-containing protein [Flavisolibacter sp.]
MLLIKDYKKIYGSFLILSVPELQLEQNLYWLQGENGSGKTTFLKSAAGLIPFNGEMYINELSLKKQRRRYTAVVNYAGAEPHYPGFLTGTDLVKFYLAAKAGNIQAVKKMAEDLNMHHYLGNKITSYSSGMIKKLSLLLAFIGEPKMILLDEPFTTLDVKAVAVLYELIKASSRKGVLFCISSHQHLTLPYVSLLVHAQKIIRQ